MNPRDIKVLKEILQEHGIERAYIFGSRARSDFREDSDLDLIIDRELRGQDLLELEDHIEYRLSMKADILSLSSPDAYHILAHEPHITISIYRSVSAM